MPDHVEHLIAHYRARGILIDTNLLVLYLIGLVDPRQIVSFKRTQAYITAHYELLAGIVQQFDAVVTTPHLLTEVSNLTAHLPKRLRLKCFEVDRALIRTLTEEHRDATVVSAHPAFHQFGMADTGIAEISPETYLVLTDDLPLYHYLSGTGVDAINFTHLRPLKW